MCIPSFSLNFRMKKFRVQRVMRERGKKKEDVGETISISVSESCRYVSFLFSVGEGLVSLSLKKR